MAYLRHPVGHLSPDCEALDEGAGGNERPVDLGLEFLGHVSKGFELVHVLVDTFQIVLCDQVLGVEQLEHAFQQPRPKVIKHFLQVDVATLVVALQLRKQVLKNLYILHVGLAICPFKHLVQRPLCVVQKLQEKLCGQRGRT